MYIYNASSGITGTLKQGTYNNNKFEQLKNKGSQHLLGISHKLIFSYNFDKFEILVLVIILCFVHQVIVFLYSKKSKK